MGRTGRHREGRVVYILAAGKEEDKYRAIEEVSWVLRRLLRCRLRRA
jgi:ERCC4-related helicase